MGRPINWTDAEVADLLAGRPVPTRTLAAAKTKLRDLIGNKGKIKRKYVPPPEGYNPKPPVSEPEWWAKANQLKGAGYTFEMISMIVSKSVMQVRYAVDRDFRDNQKRRVSTYQRTEVGRSKKIKSRKKSKRDRKRARAREAARLDWREQGGNLNDHYRRLDCL